MLTIDTGIGDSPRRFMPDWFLDLHHGDDDAKLMHDFGYYVLGELTSPKMAMTARRHILAHWAFLRALAEMHPAVFDEILTAYGERFLASG